MNKNYIILSAVLLLAVSIALFSYSELMQTKKDMFDMSRSEAENMIYALRQAVENNIKSNEIIRDEIVNSLVASTSLADHINSHKRVTKQDLIDFAEFYDLDFIMLIDKYGINSNLEIDSYSDLDTSLINYLNIINEDGYFWLDLGVNNILSDSYFLVGGEFNDKNTILVGGIHDSKLLDLRKSVGIGKLINDFSKNPEIKYVAIQDSIGIIAASINIKPISSIESDEDLKNLSPYSPLISRIIEYDGIELFETVIKLDNDEHDLFLRLGLSLSKVKAINERNTRRTIFLSLGLLFIVLGTFAFVFQRTKHIKLSFEYKQMLDSTSTVLANINEAVIGIDKEQRIILYNHKAEFLFGNVELNQKFDNYFDVKFLNLGEAIFTGKSYNYIEIEHTNNNNEKFVLAYSTSVINDSNNEPNIALSVIRDITEIRQVEEIKSRNEKLKATSSLAAGIAHEIRNPMNAINVIAQRLQLEFEPTDFKNEYSELVNTVRNEIRRIDKIISQFLEFTKPQTINPKNVDLTSVIKNSIKLLESTANQKSISIDYKYSKPAMVMIDSDKMQQVMINLIQNSIDSIQQNGKIEINLIENDNTYIIKIIDNGSGIDESIKSKIFDIYFTTKSKGTGLGLGIVNKIIDEHKGKIYFESNNQGTTFFIELGKI